MFWLSYEGKLGKRVHLNKVDSKMKYQPAKGARPIF